MVQIFAHRGCSGTFPENTMIAFKKAIEIGVDGIELDVHFTKDKELVVIHDSTVNRTTNGKGLVRNFSLNELKQLDAGGWFSKDFINQRVPTLKEVLQFMQDNNALINIELKNTTNSYEGMEDKVVNLVEELGLMDRVVISSFNHISINKVCTEYPEVECAVITSDKLYHPWEYISSIGADGLHPQWSKVEKNVVKEMRKRNLSIRLYTINKKEQFEQFLKYDITAIVTDYPFQALQIRQKIKVI